MFTEVILLDKAVLKIDWDSIFKENNTFPGSWKDHNKWKLRVYKTHTSIPYCVQNDLANYWNNEDVPSQVQFGDIFHHVRSQNIENLIVIMLPGNGLLL